MVEYFQFEKVHGHINVGQFAHEDLNVITGINGSGKTTVIKLLWYLMSANIEHIFREVKFERLLLRTTDFSLDIKMHSGKNGHHVEYYYDSESVVKSFTLGWDDSVSEARKLNELNSISGKASQKTLFFPTFRRIEGGFSLKTAPRGRGRIDHVYHSGMDLNEAMDSLSRNMSNYGHKFVCSLSTQDISNLLMAKYAEVSQQTNKMLTEVAELIITAARELTSSEDEGNRKLRDVAQRASEVEMLKDEMLNPFTVLSDLVSDIYSFKGISVGRDISLGESENAISSEYLSAGEKQMLSFLVYNAFYSGATLFIDEPELSLHVDWQRRLFSYLLKQSTGNQFFVATHSPFIYHKYSDKEVVLVSDRGDES